MELIRINDSIRYLPAGEEPLSSDVVFIDGADRTYIFDAGASDEAAEAINSVQGRKTVVISHFHRDHTANVSRIGFDRLYGSKETIRHTRTGTVITEPVVLEDDVPVTVMPMPSSHAKGCLALVYGDEYAFLGDGAYAGFKKERRVYNVYKLRETIKFLDSLNVRYFALSHYRHLVYEKKIVLEMLRAEYSKRKQGCDFIDADHL